MGKDIARVGKTGSIGERSVTGKLIGRQLGGGGGLVTFGLGSDEMLQTAQVASEGPLRRGGYGCHSEGGSTRQPTVASAQGIASVKTNLKWTVRRIRSKLGLKVVSLHENGPCPGTHRLLAGTERAR